jgi:hypothetical protein
MPLISPLKTSQTKYNEQKAIAAKMLAHRTTNLQFNQLLWQQAATTSLENDSNQFCMQLATSMPTVFFRGTIEPFNDLK